MGTIPYDAADFEHRWQFHSRRYRDVQRVLEGAWAEEFVCCWMMRRMLQLMHDEEPISSAFPVSEIWAELASWTYGDLPVGSIILEDEFTEIVRSKFNDEESLLAKRLTHLDRDENLFVGFSRAYGDALVSEQAKWPQLPGQRFLKPPAN